MADVGTSRDSEEGIISSPWDSVEPKPGETISSFVLDRVEEHGNKPAFIDARTGESMTYRELLIKIRNACNGLVKYGVKKGDVVCVILPNSIYFPVVFHAVLRTGATICTCNPLSKKDEVIYLYNMSSSKFLITSSEKAEEIHQMFEQEGQSEPQKTFVLGDGERVGCISFYFMMNHCAATSWPDVDIHPDDIATLPFSSGSTGPMKPVCHTHRSLVYSTMQMMSPGVRLTYPQDTVLATLPLFHQFGIISFLKTAMAVGNTTVVIDWFSFPLFLESIQKYKVNQLIVAPPIVHQLAKNPTVDNYDLSSLHTIICSAAPLARCIYSQINQRLPKVNIRDAFGMTEVNIVLTLAPGEKRQGSVGRPVPNTSIKVKTLAGEGHPQPGELGEMYIRCPQRFICYKGNPQATSNTIDGDGWVKTGDLVTINEDEYIYIVDRCKDLIKYKGLHVAPAELETLLLGHPEIEDAAVIGVEDEEKGELPKAYIVKASSSIITEQDVIQYVQDHICRWKRIHLVEFLSSIPKSASGKILKRELRARESQMKHRE